MELTNDCLVRKLGKKIVENNIDTKLDNKKNEK